MVLEEAKKVINSLIKDYECINGIYENDDELIDHLEKISTNVVKCGQTVVKEK